MLVVNDEFLEVGAAGVQGSLFTVGWRYFSEVLSGGLTT